MNSSFRLAETQKKQFRDQGYIILEQIIVEEDLEMLRRTCRDAIAEIEARMDAAGEDVMGITHRGLRYFIPTSFETHPELRRFYFGDLAQELLLGTLGSNAWLFLAQFTVKCAHTGLKFAWHQDSGYVDFEHDPTINLWCALDDMNEENGTLYILPSSRSGTRVRVEHTTETGTNDRVGYFGDDPGIPAIVPAGSIIAFSSVVFHRSGPNTTAQDRRAITVEYSCKPMINPSTGEQLLRAEPFLKDGRRVL